MENICNNYRNIVERAIFYGIINEEHRDFYLSAIEDENNSYLSEVENKLEEKETINEISVFKHRKDHNIRRGENDADVLFNLRVKQCLDNIETRLSMGSIENSSMLDFKSAPLNENTTVENESDTPNNEKKNKLSSNNNKKSVCKVAKKLRKPLKGQIIDFHVPIYKNLSHYNSSINDFLKYGVPKTCYSHLDKNIRCKHSQKSRLGNIRNKQLIFERDKSKPSSKPETLLKTNKLYYDSEIDPETYEGYDSSVKRKLIYTCSENRNSSETSQLFSPLMIRKGSHMPLNCPEKHRTDIVRKVKVYDDVTNDKIDSEIDRETYEDVNNSVKQKSVYNCRKNKNSCDGICKLCSSLMIKKGSHMPLCCRKKHITDFVRSEKVYDDMANCNNDPNIEQNEFLNSVDHQISDVIGDVKGPFRPSRRLDKHDFRSNVVNFQKLHDPTSDCDAVSTFSGNESPLPDSCLKRSQNKDSDKCYNVKITCHLYPLEKMKTGDDDDSKNGTNDKNNKEETLKFEDDTQTTVKSNNAENGKKAQLFSRILSTLKIKKKPKKF